MMSSSKNSISRRRSDMFVAFPSFTSNEEIIFGKNVTAPFLEAQEVVYLPPTDYPDSTQVSCTFITINQVPHTHGVILNKAAWCWGAEMGANEHGLVIGQVAVDNRIKEKEDLEEKLIGADFVRLGLERAGTAKEAVECMIALMKEHGQGGPCSEVEPQTSYDSSFLIIDRSEGWILETASNVWAAKKITSGFFHLSNVYTITNDYDMLAEETKEILQSKGLCNQDEHVNFVLACGAATPEDFRHQEEVSDFLQGFITPGEFSVTEMLKVLRSEEHGVHRGIGIEHPTYGSQVSVLYPRHSNRPCCHWFTGTPNNNFSVYKPFIFCPNSRISRNIQSPISEDDDKESPRCLSSVDRQHSLFKLHERALNLMTSEDSKGRQLLSTLRSLEATCVQDMETFLSTFTPSSYAEAEDLFKDIVESEIKFYK